MPQVNAVSTSDLKKLSRKQAPFDGFPYLITNIVDGLHHVILLPADLSHETLCELAAHQVWANRLPCLVVGTRNCTYFDPDGGHTAATSIPGAAFAICDRLLAREDFLQSQELLRRKRLLADFVQERNRGAGYLLGDPAKGGRAATTEDLRRLSGRQRNGVPQGLQQCLQCGDFRGECLDPNPEFAGLVMRACCRCENDNRCARCHGLLYEYKLNANYFDAADGKIWHVPGFSGLSHRCPEVIQCSRA